MNQSVHCLFVLELKSFENPDDCWADFCIFECQIQNLVKLLPVGVGIFPAGIGAAFVHRTIIICTEKRTRRGAEYIIPISIKRHMLCDKLAGPHLQVLGKSLHIAVFHARACGLATIGTSEAINFREYFIVIRFDVWIERFWLGFLKSVYQLPIGPFLLSAAFEFFGYVHS